MPRAEIFLKCLVQTQRLIHRGRGVSTAAGSNVNVVKNSTADCRKAHDNAD
jgi:hypothetical protein